MLQYYPCPYCFFSQEPPVALSETLAQEDTRPGPKPPSPSARCRGPCMTPFALKAHHAHGYCKRCYRFVMKF